jgi:hypothetical protein
MQLDRQSRVPRMWSNRELANIGPLFTGKVCNVSAWKDEDKEGRHYCDYFPNASEYVITNHPGERGLQQTTREIELDLEKPLPDYLYGQFAVVFNHTTLEHIYDVHTAVKNLCLMSNDIVIIVAPFIQLVHYTESYGDYWRFTPTALRRLFADNGFEVIYDTYTDIPRSAVYILIVASKLPEPWRGLLNGTPVNGNMVIGARAIRHPLYFLYVWFHKLGWL